jgi:predicted metalloprotease
MFHTFPDVFAPLLAIMQEKGKWAYQEGIVDLLAVVVCLMAKE